MTNLEIVRLRQINQSLTRTTSADPGDVVQSMGAVQAQDSAASLWAIGLRTRGATERSVEKAIAERTIIRTWPMRGTLHFVAPSDVRWMLKYLTPHIVTRAASRFRQLRLDDATFSRSRTTLTRLLRGGKHRTREAVYAALEKNGISCAGQRGIHILWRLAQEGLLCFGPREGNQPTFVLLDEWVPRGKMPPLEEAVATLAKRFFTSHGPATVRDFIWWSGLTPSVARSGFENVKDLFQNGVVDGQVYLYPRKTTGKDDAARSTRLLPAFDEYLVGYKNRSAVIDARDARKALPGGGVLRPTIVIDGIVRGIWRRKILKDKIVIETNTFDALDKSQRKGIEQAAARLGAFLGKPVSVEPQP